MAYFGTLPPANCWSVVIVYGTVNRWGRTTAIGLSPLIPSERANTQSTLDRSQETIRIQGFRGPAEARLWDSREDAYAKAAPELPVDAQMAGRFHV